MNHDSENAARLRQAVREIDARLNPEAAAAARAQPVPDAPLTRPPASEWSKVCTIVGAIALFNFLAFLIGCAALGGDALNGKSEGGRYYVSNHGKLTEVSESAFTYSEIHCYSVFITHALIFICVVANWEGKKATRKSRESANSRTEMSTADGRR